MRSTAKPLDPIRCAQPEFSSAQHARTLRWKTLSLGLRESIARVCGSVKRRGLAAPLGSLYDSHRKQNDNIGY